ncbi:MAG: deoxyribose-phosphate aldolase [Bdellovibrionales bacterium]
MTTAFKPQDLARYIDHTLLKPEATLEHFETLCREARDHQFYGVCVPSRVVKHAKKWLVSTQVKVVSVVGFPLGHQNTKVKGFETSLALSDGADEIDMVVSLGGLKEKNWDFVQEDIACVVQASQGRPVKVILETHLLNQDEKIKAIELSIQAGAHFVKTSTGFTGGGATLEDVALMKKTARGRIHIKASGGIKTFDQAIAMIQEGATRIGTSSGVLLVQNQQAPSGGY